jgi:hypothetical protein
VFTSACIKEEIGHAAASRARSELLKGVLLAVQNWTKKEKNNQTDTDEVLVDQSHPCI